MLYTKVTRELEDLKSRYWEAGLHIKAIQPRQQRSPRALGEKEILPPMLLSIYKSKKNNPLPNKTKTKTPLLKQIIIEPQTNSQTNIV